MIITKTPFRLSFFGGGTDYPEHYLKFGGAVLATSINKYCYISCRPLPPFFAHKYRIAYSKIENAHSIDEIEHPAVKSVLSYLDCNQGMEIHHDGDLPARSGLGSSSSFTVGLLKAIHAFQGRITNNYELGLQAIDVEREIIGEKVGSQDQMTAAVGGFNRITFGTNGVIKIDPIILGVKRLAQLKRHLMIFYTGVSRFSQDVTAKKIIGIKQRPNDVSRLGKMVEEATQILSNCNEDITHFGELLKESWMIKKSLAPVVSSEPIDVALQAACENGAIGGKIMGAGGGGFLLIFAAPEFHEKIINVLKNLVHVPFDFDKQGSTVCVYEPHGL